jgi:hypothetical protein
MSDDNNDGGDVDEEALKDPDTAELFEAIANRHDHDNVLFRSLRWLENFREMKQAAIDALYPDGDKCPKNMSVLHFILQMLMWKARHGCTDTSFNDLLRILSETLPEGNKVPANTYRAKKLVKPVAMKLKKFHVCPNHCICIGTSMRRCRAVHIVARVGTRGMPVVVQTWTRTKGRR